MGYETVIIFDRNLVKKVSEVVFLSSATNQKAFL